ncbi:hypothetical protein [Mucilaginibacter sp.]|uniref:hypothetical protein n=1 Tax=Mucilaginibacter sp. TaxID=1882438 RepID=UPI0025DBABF0|nr:hypothetical protein [Mucilaginibacter sp.]
MNITRNDYQRLFSKWLLAAVLILSFFTFSGPGVRSQPKFAAQKTEVVKANESCSVRTISFSRALKQIPLGFSPSAIFSARVISLAQIHGVLAKTRFINCQYCTRPRAVFFYQRKTIPNNNGDEPIALA